VQSQLTCLHAKANSFREQNDEEKKGKHVCTRGEVAFVGASENCDCENSSSEELLEESRYICHVVKLKFSQRTNSGAIGRHMKSAYRIGGENTSSLKSSHATAAFEDINGMEISGVY
jgi:hypothetical protein